MPFFLILATIDHPLRWILGYLQKAEITNASMSVGVCVPACLELSGTVSSELLIILTFNHNLNDYVPEIL